MKILKIEDFDSIDDEEFGGENYYKYEGYKITTDVKEIYIVIDNGALCCESWGHIQSEDDLNSFVGANILDYRCVEDADYKEIELTKNDAGEYVEIYDCAFIDFKTDKGDFQLAVYNHHNGFYGHDIRILEQDAR